MILSEAHVGVAGGHYAGKVTMRNILHEGLWWPTMHVDARDYCRSCDIYQRTGNTSRRDEMPLVSHITLQEFDKWVVEFVAPISPLGKHTGVRYMVS